MSFDKRLKKLYVPEWKDAYIKCAELKSLTEPSKLMVELSQKVKYHEGTQDLILFNMRDSDLK